MDPAVVQSQGKSRVLEFPEVRPKPLWLATLTPSQKSLLDELGKERLIAMYRKMVEIRSFEQRAEQMYQQRKIGGFLHLYMGQEAVAVGMLSAARPNDYVVCSYRDHGIALARDIPSSALMAELFGKATGVSKGKGGSMHFYSREKNLLGGHGIVGGQIPVGVGAAFRARYMKTDQVSLIFLGDGAINQGSFHESCNLAALWDLPAIFIIENNQYGMGTSVRRATSVQNLAVRAGAYGMEGLQIDGMNLLECYGVMKEAVAKRRQHPCPILIEAKTYRYRGHSISDPGQYRTKDEIESYQKVDPLAQVKRLLQELNWLDEAAGKELERAVRQEIAEAVKFAEESPDPEQSERDTDVYAP
jgi:pyruvate dehydrogenase E1 component alpha subunit